jgi:hypothetical protein
LRTVTKLTPAGYSATNRTWTSIAFTVLIIEQTTRKFAVFTTVGCDVQLFAGSLLHTLAASYSALTPSGPVGHLAIHRACFRLASLRLTQVRARLAVMSGLSQNDTIASAETSVA